MAAHKNWSLKLKVWRQKDAQSAGAFKDYVLTDVSAEMSFLEMLDVLNEQLIAKGEDPIAFDHDCREGICGSCGFMINGQAHGPMPRTTVCQLHMRSFKDGDELWLEPFRAKAFPIQKDLVTDRAAFDKIQQASGFISVRTGAAPDANSIPVPKEDADLAMDAATCIGCGACVAACKNASAMLFVAAKVSHLGLMPQGQPERDKRVLAMVQTMDEAGFGNCTNQYECSAVCPKLISHDFIARMNRDYVAALFKSRFKPASNAAAGGAG